jgi:hypothetical protein
MAEKFKIAPLNAEKGDRCIKLTDFRISWRDFTSQFVLRMPWPVVPPVDSFLHQSAYDLQQEPD